MTAAHLTLDELTVTYPGDPPVPAVRGVTLRLDPGKVCGIVGESGSGKSTLAAAIIGLVPGRGRVTAGTITFEGADLTALGTAAWRSLRGRRIAMVFQDHAEALDPLLTVGGHLNEALALARGLRGAAARQAALELLREVAISDPERRLRQYPHELSGGMRQRLLIALALAGDPELLIADEPTTALDVTIQAQILELLLARQRSRGLTLLVVSHALPLIAGVADRVVVMYGGRVIETAPAALLFGAPRHPYTMALLRANPDVDRDAPIAVIPGAPPRLSALPPGCPFAPRCEFARDGCRTGAPPPLLAVAADHLLACPVDPHAPGAAHAR